MPNKTGFFRLGYDGTTFPCGHEVAPRTLVVTDVDYDNRTVTLESRMSNKKDNIQSSNVRSPPSLRTEIPKPESKNGRVGLAEFEKWILKQYPPCEAKGEVLIKAIDDDLYRLIEYSEELRFHFQSECPEETPAVAACAAVANVGPLMLALGRVWKQLTCGASMEELFGLAVQAAKKEFQDECTNESESHAGETSGGGHCERGGNPPSDSAPEG